MWGLIAVLAASAVAMGIMIDDDDDTSSDQVTDQDQDIDDEVEENPGFTRVSLDALVGTEFDDELDVDALEDPNLIDTITAGDGDDTLELSDRENFERHDPFDFWGLDIDTGSGDDVVEVIGAALEIDLGDGDDTLTARLNNSTVQGGDGDDFIDVSANAPDLETYTYDFANQLNVDGGEGDDVIQARYVTEVLLEGGAGNDLIVTGGGQSWEGSDDKAFADGGEGDDIIQYYVDTLVGDYGLEDGNGAVGGEGEDRFELIINEGDEEVSERHDAYVYGELVELVNGGAVFVDENTLRIETIWIADFEPGVDTVSLDATPQNDGYDLTALAMEENDAGSATDLILTYERADDLTRQVVVTLGSGGVTWDDIELAEGSEYDLEELVNGPEVLTFDENGDLTGTSGDDSINDIGGAGDVSAESPQIAALGAGDDIAIDTGNTDWMPREIAGGEGDDHLVSETYGVVLNGDEGDDVLSGIPSSLLSGGDGDDTLTVDLTYGLNDSVGTADGGDGDDHIEIITEVVKDPLPDFSSVWATGGDGQDTFNVIVNTPSSNTFDPENDVLPDLVGSPSGVTITDFDPEEDVLTIDVSAGGIAEFDRIDVDNDPDSDRSYVSLYFLGTDSFPPIVTTIRLDNAPDVTVDDIVLVT